MAGPCSGFYDLAGGGEGNLGSIIDADVESVMIETQPSCIYIYMIEDGIYEVKVDFIAGMDAVNCIYCQWACIPFSYTTPHFITLSQTK